VTSFALKAINAQFKRLKCEPIVIVPCIDIFTKTMGLSCAHKIQKRWYDRASGNVLKLEDIHSHWRFTKPPQTRQATTRQEDNIAGDNNDEVTKVRGTSSETSSSSPKDRQLFDDILRVQELVIVKSKDRSRDSLNKAWAASSQSQRRR